MCAATADPESTSKQMRLRYAGRCRACGADLPAGTAAVYDRATKTVACLGCAIGSAPTEPDSVEHQVVPPEDSGAAAPEPEPELALLEEPDVVVGTAGSSARREHERRKNKRETGIREAHPRLGGVILALFDDPQSTKAWAVGARGEELLGQRLNGLAEHGVKVLHDRRIPPTKANIDHIAVGPTGVFVIDAKRYKGQPRLRVEGGILRPRTEKLMVGSRDCTKLVTGVHKQLDRVRSALESADLADVPVHGMLCFVEADWPLIGGTFTISELYVLFPRKAVEYLVKPGPLDDAAIQRVHRTLAEAFPPA
jgi:hypothetical protein